jgi:hypothetical protein
MEADIYKHALKQSSVTWQLHIYTCMRENEETTHMRSRLRKFKHFPI